MDDDNVYNIKALMITKNIPKIINFKFSFLSLKIKINQQKKINKNGNIKGDDKP